MNILLYSIIVLLALASVFADYLIKLSTQAAAKSAEWMFFGPALVIYALTAFGWFYVMKHIKLSTIGVWYAVPTVLFLTFIGVVYFKESLNLHEVVGIIAAILSLILLTRFS